MSSAEKEALLEMAWRMLRDVAARDMASSPSGWISFAIAAGEIIRGKETGWERNFVVVVIWSTLRMTRGRKRILLYRVLFRSLVIRSLEADQ